MELSMSGNSLKTFNRCVTCLSRVGTELVFQASPSKMELHTLNASRSAYQSISFVPSFFDTYSVVSSPNGSDSSTSSPDPVQCSVLLKAVAAVLRTPAVSVDRLSVSLPSPDASKIQFSLHCNHGVKKTYHITCNAEPEIQHLSLDRARFPSNLVVRPRDLSRLLSNFQSSLHEITIIATEVASGEPPAGGQDGDDVAGGKAVELRSYIDPAKEDSDARLHTQLWIDPVEEFLQYTHAGDPVDVTFGVKELKAFLAFCEGCEVDIHLFFEKAGEPILMAPRFGFDGSSSDFDASLVLATMLVSQLTEPNNNNINNDNINNNNNTNEIPVDHSEPVTDNNTTEQTKIWSELSGTQMNRENQEQEGNPNISSVQNGIQGLNVVNAPQETRHTQQGVETDHVNDPQVMEVENNILSQHHPSNWIGDEENEDDDDDDDEELFVQSTPQY
ncbi:hypothetical protein LUZ60_013948 [Juncus effusus]|nr:hypothetical protein LUZ60_013948 [Juncus effusus]